MLRNIRYLLQRACLCGSAARLRAATLVKMQRLMADLLKNCFTRVERTVKIVYQDVPPPFFLQRDASKGVANGPIVIGLFCAQF